MQEREVAQFAGREQTVHIARAALMRQVAIEQGNIFVNIVKWPGESFSPPGCDEEVALCSLPGSEEQYENVRLTITGQENASVEDFYAEVSNLESEIRKRGEKTNTCADVDVLATQCEED